MSVPEETLLNKTGWLVLKEGLTVDDLQKASNEKFVLPSLSGNTDIRYHRQPTSLIHWSFLKVLQCHHDLFWALLCSSFLKRTIQTAPLSEKDSKLNSESDMQATRNEYEYEHFGCKLNEVNQLNLTLLMYLAICCASPKKIPNFGIGMPYGKYNLKKITTALIVATDLTYKVEGKTVLDCLLNVKSVCAKRLKKLLLSSERITQIPENFERNTEAFFEGIYRKMILPQSAVKSAMLNLEYPSVLIDVVSEYLDLSIQNLSGSKWNIQFWANLKLLARLLYEKNIEELETFQETSKPHIFKFDQYLLKIMTRLVNQSKEKGMNLQPNILSDTLHVLSCPEIRNLNTAILALEDSEQRKLRIRDFNQRQEKNEQNEQKEQCELKDEHESNLSPSKVLQFSRPNAEQDSKKEFKPTMMNTITMAGAAIGTLTLGFKIYKWLKSGAGNSKASSVFQYR